MHFELSHFLKYEHWTSGIELLEAQIDMSEHNAHFKTLACKLYKDSDNVLNTIKTKEFFEDFVSTGLFYGLEDIFKTHSYSIPKNGLGVRNFHFMSLPMRILYYAIGSYIIEITEEFMSFHEGTKVKKTISTYYGGKLITNNNKLVLNLDNLYFLKHYRDFKEELLDEARNNKPFIIRFDIENYFDNVNIRNLLDNIEKYIKPGVKLEKRYDEITKSTISTFLRYMLLGHDGLPQADNDIISSYLANLNLITLDYKIEGIIQKNKNTSTFNGRHKIVRYIDDIFIFLEPDILGDLSNPPLIKEELKQEAILLSNLISEQTFSNLGLRFNNKSQLFYLTSDKDREEFLDVIKKISIYNVDISNEKSVHRKYNTFIDSIHKFKDSNVKSNFTFNNLKEIEDGIKGIYDKNLRKYILKKERKRELRWLLRDINLHNTSYLSDEFNVILSIFETTKFRYKIHLKRNIQKTAIYYKNLLTFLLVNDFHDEELIEILHSSTPFGKIINYNDNISNNFESVGYFNISFDNFSRIKNQKRIIGQIHLRRLSEINKDYTVALSHLLNEVHVICESFDPNRRGNDYKAPNAIEYLFNKSVPKETIIGIQNLFDRRNKSPVSHADNNAIPVSKTEYFYYKNMVGNCIQHILT